MAIAPYKKKLTSTLTVVFFCHWLGSYYGVVLK